MELALVQETKMKKQYLILMGMILLIGSIIAVGELTSINYKNKNLNLDLTTNEKQILNEQSNSNLIVGDIYCRDKNCMIQIKRDNKMFAIGYLTLIKDIKLYSGEEFMELRDLAIENAVKNKIKQMGMKPNVIQKVNASGTITSI